MPKIVHMTLKDITAGKYNHVSNVKRLLQPDTITLADFCGCLADAFYREYDADYTQAHSIDYAMEFLCQDNYYTWQGKDITDIVNAYMVAK